MLQYLCSNIVRVINAGDLCHIGGFDQQTLILILSEALNPHTNTFLHECHV